MGLQRGCHQPITPVPPVAGAPTTLSIAPCLHLPVGHPGRPHTHREGMIHDCRPRAGRTEPLARLHPAPRLCRLLPTERLCLPATSAGGRGREPGTPSFSVSLLLNSYTIDVTSDCLQVTLERAGDPWLFMKTVPAILKTTPHPPSPQQKDGKAQTSDADSVFWKQVRSIVPLIFGVLRCLEIPGLNQASLNKRCDAGVPNVIFT